MYKFESNTLQAICDYYSQMEEVGVIVKNILMYDHKIYSDEILFDVACEGVIKVDGREMRLKTAFTIFGDTINLIVSQPDVYNPLLSAQVVITINKNSQDGDIFTKLMDLYNVKRELLLK